MKKKYLVITMLFLAIGFASVAVTLFVNGTIKVSANTEEFDVYFSKVLVDGVEDNSLISDDTHITFLKEFKSFGDTHEVEYYITNGSTNYDAKVSVSCSEGNDYVEVTSDWVDETVINSTETKSGKLTMSLKRTYTGDTSLNLPVTCEIIVNATERDSKGTGTPASKVEQGINLFNLIKSQAKTDTIDFSVNSMTSGTNGVYTTTATDSNSSVYYFRGSHEGVNNNIIFNNMCWKIIRTTETGGVKIIYNGLTVNGECTTTTGSSTSIGSGAFNDNDDDMAYVGYMYGTVGSSIYEETHRNTNDSTIKTYIDNWFENNFDAETTVKLEDTVFCNNRKVSEVYSYYTYFDSLTVDLYGGQPSLVCSQVNDKFTVNENIGNGKLIYPVGLVTIDELIFSGFSSNSNIIEFDSVNNYLYSNTDYWTMSPINFSGDSKVVVVDKETFTDWYPTCFYFDIRPVVSLASGTLIRAGGDGSMINPYVVQ